MNKVMPEILLTSSSILLFWKISTQTRRENRLLTQFNSQQHMTNLVSVVFFPPYLHRFTHKHFSMYLFGLVGNHNAFSHAFLIVSCVFAYCHQSSLIAMDWEVQVLVVEIAETVTGSVLFSLQMCSFQNCHALEFGQGICWHDGGFRIWLLTLQHLFIAAKHPAM